MKVLFAPNYFYLNFPIFESVARNLRAREIQTIFVRTPSHSPTEADLEYTDEYLTSRGIDLDTVFDRHPSRKGGRVAQLLSIGSEFQQVERSLARIRPDVVVVGSDLGNLRIRLLLTASELAGIPVTILYTCDVPAQLNTSVDRVRRRLFARARMRWSRLCRACVFIGATPGEFATRAHIGVLSAAIRTTLVERGLSEARITVTGLPGRRSDEHGGGVKSGTKVVLTISPIAHESDGALEPQAVWAAVRELSARQRDVSFVVKLHPRETPSTVNAAAEFFSGTHVRVVKDGTAEDWLPCASLVLAPTSRAVYTALAAGVPVLVLGRDTQRLPVPGPPTHEDLASLPGCVADLLNDEREMTRLASTCASAAAVLKSADAVDAMVRVVLAAGSQHQ